MIRILIVEDNDLDVELTRQILQLRGMDCELTRVANRKLFIEHLRTQPPDLVLSDHGMECFDGFSAFRLSRQLCPEVPFIFLSGGMTEDDKHRLAGETNARLILKQDMFSDLVPAIHLALGSADHSRVSRGGWGFRVDR